MDLSTSIAGGHPPSRRRFRTAGRSVAVSAIAAILGLTAHAGPATAGDPTEAGTATESSTASMAGTPTRTTPRNLAAGLDYNVSEAPDPAYPDSGRELTDGQYGTLDRTDPAWVGHTRGRTREVVLDLGADKSVSRIEAHFLQDWPTSSILVPLTVSMAVSDDGRTWATLTHESTQLLWGDGPPRDETNVWDGSTDGLPHGSPQATMAYARYVKLSFSVHTRASQLLDEIEVHGLDTRHPRAKRPRPDRPGYQRPGVATAGISDLALLYNGHYDHGKGDWTTERILPYLGYVDASGRPVDRLFDG
ncbi:MAG TPA: DUF4855 domain-containing protein, partial [Actinopolymorphaceae bacterium]